MNTLLLQGGTLFLDSGASDGDLLIAGERIVEIGRIQPPSEATVVDCNGLAVCAGFIDGHSHSDLQVLENRTEKSLQGVTTEIVGNCGFSAFPALADRRSLHQFANGIFRGGEQWGWTSSRQYLEEARRSARLATVGALVGHGALRIAHAGLQLGPLPEPVLDAMAQQLSEALSEGACGLSTGLMYAPGESAPFDELERLCRVVARHGKIYTTHMRDYGFKLLESLDEQIRLARQTGCRLQISHLQAVGPANWHLQAPALEKIENASREGIDIAFDCYPYIAGSTVLTQWLPQWSMSAGIPGLIAALGNPAERTRIATATVSAMAHQWSDLVVSSVASEANRPLIGQTLQKVGELRGLDPIDAALDLLIEENAAVNILEFNQSDDNLRATLTHPLSTIISDGFYVRGRPHPRLHGAFPHFLGGICRDRRWLTFEDAIRKVTSAPADRYGIARRGRLLPGYYADVVVFDRRRIGSPATYQEPELPPVGIHYVMKNGRLIHQTPPGPASRSTA